MLFYGSTHAQQGASDVLRLIEESKEIIKSVKEEDLKNLAEGASSEKLDKMLKDKNLQDMVKNSVKLSNDSQNEAMNSIKSCRTHKCKTSKDLAKMMVNREKELSKFKDQMIIFVSSSMPKESLKSLFLEAQKVGVRLVFRGLIRNSFKETQNYFRDLQINADVDPMVFEEYAITTVPSFLVQDKTSGKKDVLKGHISLREALIKFKDRGDLKEISTDLLSKLDGQA